MNEVRFIQKIGQVSMETLVETAAKQGFVLAGSPTLISHVPAQLMVHVGVQSDNPEYRMVSKTGQLKLSHQIADLLNEGWHIYGSMLTGDVPMQAMVRGDIGVHKMFGMDGSGPSDDSDWSQVIRQAKEDAINTSKTYTDTVFATVDEQLAAFDEQLADTKEALLENLKREINSINEAGEMLDEKINGVDQHSQMMESAIGELVVKNAKEHDDIYSFIEQTRSTLDSDMRGNVTGLQSEIEMETSERIKDVTELNARLDQMTRIMAQLVDQPAS